MKKLLLGIFLTLISISACKKEHGLSWNTTYNVPLATTTIKLDDFIPDSLLDQNSNPIKLIYNATLYELDKSLLFNIPDTTIKYPFVLPFGSLTVFPGQIISENEQEVSLPSGQAQLSSMVVESGFLKYKITSRILQPIIVHYEIRSATKNSEVLTVEVEVPGALSTSIPAVFGGQVNLYNYSIDLTGKNHNTINKVVAYTRLKLSTNSQQTEINSNTGIDFDVTFNQLKPYYARGYFGQTTININPTTTKIDVFNNIKSGTFSLSKASCKLDIINGVGADARLNIKSIYSINEKNNEKISLQNNNINKNFNINRAIDNPYKNSSKVLTFNETNSNLISMIENQPNKIGYELSVELNPLGNISSGTDFIYSDRLFKANLSLEIPLNSKLNKVLLQDTLRINADNSDQDIINNGKLYFNIHNYFQNNVSFDVFLINDDNSVGLKISSDNIIAPSTNNSSQSISIDLNTKNIHQLFKSKKLLFKVLLDSNDSFVEINNWSRLEIQASATFEKTLYIK